MNLITFDVETSGTLPEHALQPCRVRTKDAWLTSAAWHVHKDAVETQGWSDQDLDRMAWDTEPDIDDIRHILRECARKKIYVGGWNIAFDAAWLVAYGLEQEVLACSWIDGMLLYKQLTNTPTFEHSAPSRSLKAFVASHFPQHANYEVGVDFHDPSPEARHTLRRYNKMDAALTNKSIKLLWNQLSSAQQRVALIEARAIPHVARMHVQGITLDAGAVEKLDTKLREDAVVAKMQLNMLYDQMIDEKVLSSNQQLAELLKSWNLPVLKMTAKGASSVDRETLTKLATMDPRVVHIRDYREALSNRAKFVVGMQNSLQYNGDGCTRPAMHIFGTYTARATFSSKQGRGASMRATGIPIHQWKRDAEFRRCIKAPEGYTLIEWDFAGQEFRWMAVESNDPTMLGLCAPGEDAHAYMGAQLASVAYDVLREGVKCGDQKMKSFRQLGKIANLSLQYRTSALRLQQVAVYQHNIPMTARQANHTHSMYQIVYPRVPMYWQRQKQFVTRHAYVDNMLGRRVIFQRYTPSPQATKRADAWNYISTAINYPIQSMGAEQKYLAIMVLGNEIQKYDGRVYFELHDGLFAIVPTPKAEKAARELGIILSNLPYERAWQLHLPVPFPVDTKIGPSWGDLESLEVT